MLFSLHLVMCLAPLMIGLPSFRFMKSMEYDSCFTVAQPSCSCQNRGTCSNGLCSCIPGTEGTSCELLIDCPLFIFTVYNTTGDVVNPCGNGVCPRDGVTVSCLCDRGYTGSTCTELFDNCASVPCQNGARCINALNAYSCVCPLGYTGATCSLVINNCASNPCSFGTCTNLIGAFRCTCSAGYTGQTCAEQINNCVSNQCANGTCVNGVASYTCACASGYVGTFCTIGLS
jgi:hypothetical protein